MDFLRRFDDSEAFFLNIKNTIDKRGSFYKIFQESSLIGNHKFSPKECYLSSSKKNVLRGFHLQVNNSIHGKVVSCIEGKVLDVLVDLREGNNFGRVFSSVLDAAKKDTIFVPKGYGHAFLNLNKEDALLLYLVETEYSPENDSGVLWDSVNFRWPINDPIISDRDKYLIDFKNFKPIKRQK